LTEELQDLLAFSADGSIDLLAQITPRLQFVLNQYIASKPSLAKKIDDLINFTHHEDSTPDRIQGLRIYGQGILQSLLDKQNIEEADKYLKAL
ncbi:hypothetical protein ABTL37_19160, partial [Acinetobacter baumannii]